MNRYISDSEIVALTQEIVRRPSVNPPADSTQCARFILDRFEENGIDAEIMEGTKGVANVVARLPGRKKGKVLLLNGHIDVVQLLLSHRVATAPHELLREELVSAERCAILNCHDEVHRLLATWVVPGGAQQQHVLRGRAIKLKRKCNCEACTAFFASNGSERPPSEQDPCL